MMSSFFKETLKARLYSNKGKHLLLEIDWQHIGNQLRKVRQFIRGKLGYDPLKMLKAVFLGNGIT